MVSLASSELLPSPTSSRRLGWDGGSSGSVFFFLVPPGFLSPFGVGVVIGVNIGLSGMLSVGTTGLDLLVGTPILLLPIPPVVVARLTVPAVALLPSCGVTAFTLLCGVMLSADSFALFRAWAFIFWLILLAMGDALSIAAYSKVAQGELEQQKRSIEAEFQRLKAQQGNGHAQTQNPAKKEHRHSDNE